MLLKHLTYLIETLSIKVDEGERIDVAETVEHIENATLFAWLAEKYTPRDPNFLYAFEGKRGEESPVWESAAPEILAAFTCELEPELNRIRKKFGIEHNGLCLVISWTAELIGRRVWTEDPPAEGRLRDFGNLGDPPQF
jgi:hypothetical protein